MIGRPEVAGRADGSPARPLRLPGDAAAAVGVGSSAAPRRAAYGALALAILSAIALAVGLAYALGTTGDGDRPGPMDASLLLVAEALKICSALALLLMVSGDLRVGRHRSSMLAIGACAAAALAIAGVLGVAALVLGQPALGRAVPPVALAALAGTGAWTVLLLHGADAMKRRSRVLGGAYAAAALAAWLAPPLGLLAGVLGPAWWASVAVRLRNA